MRRNRRLTTIMWSVALATNGMLRVIALAVAGLVITIAAHDARAADYDCLAEADAVEQAAKNRVIGQPPAMVEAAYAATEPKLFDPKWIITAVYAIPAHLRTPREWWTYAAGYCAGVIHQRKGWVASPLQESTAKKKP